MSTEDRKQALEEVEVAAMWYRHKAEEMFTATAVMRNRADEGYVVLEKFNTANAALQKAALRLRDAESKAYAANVRQTEIDDVRIKGMRA